MDETQQVGFLKLDLDENGEYVATRQYEINERKAGIANVTYGGVSQKYLRGFQNYLGVNLKKINGMNFQGNGQACGNQAVGIEMKFKDTYNPMYSGQSLLSIYGEVERTFLLKKGKVFVTTSSIWAGASWMAVPRLLSFIFFLHSFYIQLFIEYMFM